MDRIRSGNGKKESPAPPPRLRVLVADDHPLVREEVVTILNASADVEVIAEAADGAEAARTAMETRPDLVILDVSMPKMSGVEAARVIHNTLPQTRILVLTMHDEKEYVASMLDAGASGYLLKDAAPGELLLAVGALREGRTYVSP